MLTRPKFDMGRSKWGPPTGMLRARTVRPRPGCVRACAVSGANPAAAVGAAAAACGLAARVLALSLCSPKGRDVLRPRACRAPGCSTKPDALSAGAPRKGVANAGSPKGLAADGAAAIAASTRLRGVAAHDVEAMDGVSEAVPVEPELLRVPSCQARGGLPASMLARRRGSGACLTPALKPAPPAAVRLDDGGGGPAAPAMPAHDQAVANGVSRSELAVRESMPPSPPDRSVPHSCCAWTGMRAAALDRSPASSLAGPAVCRCNVAMDALGLEAVEPMREGSDVVVIDPGHESPAPATPSDGGPSVTASTMPLSRAAMRWMSATLGVLEEAGRKPRASQSSCESSRRSAEKLRGFSVGGRLMEDMDVGM